VEPAPIAGNCIDINTASIERLEEIMHIGPARAQELINLRPFSSVDDLGRIKGIGPARIADIKSQGLACVGG
jgi:competence protein ComEC